jgi:hypothetical protein
LFQQFHAGVRKIQDYLFVVAKEKATGWLPPVSWLVLEGTKQFLWIILTNYPMHAKEGAELETEGLRVE